jgi:hypothetical protein
MDQIIEQLFALLPSSTLGQIVALYLLSSLLSLLIARKSQVDAWAESRPRLAAALKLLRSLGLDPWMALQALSLAAHRRLPAPPAVQVEKPKPKISTPPPFTVVLLVAALPLLPSCASAASGERCTAEQLTQGELAAVVIECAARRAQACPDAGEEEPCPGVDEECDARIDARCK